MYTPEGNWDLVGNNIPVLFIQDAIKFPDLIHSVKPEPNNEIPQASSAHDTFYDFMFPHAGIDAYAHMDHERSRHSAASGQGVELVKETKTDELVTNADAAEQGVLFADDADGLASDFIEAIAHHRFHNRHVDKIMA